MKSKNGNIYSGEFGVNNQLYFCGIPFRLDSYSGCSHNCRYCFARSAELTNLSHIKRQKRVTQSILPADNGVFQRKLFTALDWGHHREDISIEWLKRRVPIHWGGMSDPFQPCEEKYQVSRKWMEYLNDYQYPVAISTKGTEMITKQPYLQLLKEGNYVVQITLIGDDPSLQQLEPGCPSPEERLRHIGILIDAGLHVVVRIQPVIPNSILEQKLPEFIAKLGKLGVKHILTEGYKVQARQNDYKNEVFRLYPNSHLEYKYPDTRFEGFELLLPSWRKWQYVKVARDVAHQYGMTYGAADNDMRNFGDTICCCGLDNVPGFENFWRYQSSQAVKIAEEKGIVTLQNMQLFWNGGEQSMDSGNILNNDMYLEKYGYAKGKAKEKNSGGGLLGIQKGKMRDEARSNSIRYTAKWCVDWMWNNGGSCSPEEIVHLKRISNGEEIAYEYRDPVPMLEASQVKQSVMF